MIGCSVSLEVNPAIRSTSEILEIDVKLHGIIGLSWNILYGHMYTQTDRSACSKQ